MYLIIKFYRDASKLMITFSNCKINLGLSKNELASIAATIGADCAFFVYDSPMICKGIGDIMEPVALNLSGYNIVIAKPLGVSISTKEAYAGVTPMLPEVSLREILSLPISQWQGNLVNDFEKSIFKIAPQIADLKNTMLDHGAVYASMSGSG